MKSPDSQEEIVNVEAGLGPEFGYYHDKELSDAVGPQEMPRSEAEDRGYSPCCDCFPEVSADAQ